MESIQILGTVSNLTLGFAFGQMPEHGVRPCILKPVDAPKPYPAPWK